jgi:2,5-diamino-6-(ribosylamino)-4(3H)-pyrimidinone 5'-phosphate reductase
MKRPFVYLNMAMTVDGKITSATREYPRLTSRHDRDTMDRLRAEADAMLVGARTIRDDNPTLHVRSTEMQAYRESLGKSDPILKVLVSASLDLDLSSRFFDDTFGTGRIVATTDDAPEERVARLEPKAEVWRLGPQRVDLAELLTRLAQRGVERLLVEGGGELNWALVRDDLVDELNVTIAPALLGGRDAPTLLQGEGLKMADQRRLRLIDVRREGNELYCRYEVER